MKILLSTLMMLLLLVSAGCGGGGEGDESPEGTAGAATESTTTEAATEAAEASSEEPTEDLDVAIGTLIGKVQGEDWRLVEKMTEQFYEGKLDALYAQFSPGFKEVWSKERLKDFRDETLTKFGTETELVGSDREATTTPENIVYRVYRRAVRFSDHEGLVEVAWLLNEKQQVSGLFITPAQKPGN